MFDGKGLSFNNTLLSLELHVEGDQTEHGSSGQSVLTLVPQHEVWGGQSLLRELSRLTAEVRCIEQLRHVILQPLPLNHHLLSDSNGPPEQDPYAVSCQSSSPTYRK